MRVLKHTNKYYIFCFFYNKKKKKREKFLRRATSSEVSRLYHDDREDFFYCLRVYMPHFATHGCMFAWMYALTVVYTAKCDGERAKYHVWQNQG